jgi:hypothetical protein
MKVLSPEKRLSQRKNYTIRQRQQQIGDKNAQSVLFLMYPCLSNFYQNVGFLPSRLIFHSLRPCRASGIYLMWESLFMKFVSFLQTEPSIYCF